MAHSGFSSHPSAFSSDASVSGRMDSGSYICVLQGVWTVHTLGQVEKTFNKTLSTAPSPVEIHLDGISRLDTAAALCINENMRKLKERGGKVQAVTSNTTWQKLLQASVYSPEKQEDTGARGWWLPDFLEGFGRQICDFLWSLGQLMAFMGHFMLNLVLSVLHPKRMRWTSLVHHMEQVGLRAVPIVGLLTFLIGLVVAYMGAQELSRFGAQVFAVNLLEVTIMREMGVLITAIVVAGRSSSSFTAQIGAMVANEEVAAMRSMGLDPVDLLVIPRVLALIITLPILVFLADIMALAGGALAIWYSMDLSIPAFFSRLHQVAQLKNFLVGIVKTPFFAVVIGVVGCFQGFRATSSAESVGFLTTISVVQAIFIVIVLDAVFAVFFTSLGI